MDNYPIEANFNTSNVKVLLEEIEALKEGFMEFQYI